MSKLDTQNETRIVVLKARGDTYEDIKKALAKDGIEMSISGLQKVIERNKEAMTYIKGELVQHQTTKTSRILDKTREQIERKLDAANGDVPVLQELIELRDAGEIDDNEFARLSMQAVSAHGISMRDLVSTSKEMFNQSQIEAGKPTSITESPEQAKRNLSTLLEAINNRDDKAMIDAVFIDV